MFKILIYISLFLNHGVNTGIITSFQGILRLAKKSGIWGGKYISGNYAQQNKALFEFAWKWLLSFKLSNSKESDHLELDRVNVTVNL
jgi:hypothetical protein